MMRSATAFLPDSMITFMNLDRSTLPHFGSGRISRLGTSRRRGISLPFDLQSARAHTLATDAIALTRHPLTRGHRTTRKLRICATTELAPRRRSPGDSLGLLGTLGTVLGTGLLAILHALQIQRAAHDVVAHARQILHTAAAHEHDAVLLQVVARTTDVGDDLEAVGQAHLGDLTQSRVRLLRRGGVDAGADAAALRAALHGRRLGLRHLGLATLAHELVDGWHG